MRNLRQGAEDLHHEEASGDIDWRNREHDQCTPTATAMRYGNDYQWIAFFDFDEHLKLTTAKNIKEVLNGIDADCVSLFWRTMTDNNLVVYSAGTLEKRFTQPAPEKTKDHNGIVANYFLKSIVRGGLPGFIGTSTHAGYQRHTALHRRRDQTRRRCLLSAP